MTNSPGNSIIISIPKSTVDQVRAKGVSTPVASLISAVSSALATIGVTAVCLRVAPAATAYCPLIGSVVGSLIGGVLGQAASGTLNDPKAWAANITSAIIGGLGGNAPKALAWAKANLPTKFLQFGTWLKVKIAKTLWAKFLGASAWINNGGDFLQRIARQFPTGWRNPA